MRFFGKSLSIVVLIIVCGILFVTLRSVAPSNFPSGKVISIPKDSTLTSVAALLLKERVIRSQFFYKGFVVLLGGEKDIKVGDYLFSEPQSALKIASRTIEGDLGLARTKITIPEGSSSKDIARIIQKGIPTFDTVEFLALAKEHEGYLFPDTYFLYETVSPTEVIQELRKNFDAKMASIEKELATSTIPLKDLIIMASIVEREGISNEDRKIIAGILWKRLEVGMALQVDAAFYYLLGKPSSQLTAEDLKMDSPYNTYKYAGLPPGPISNPGLEAILDTLQPVKTPYWYYLTGKDKVMYYAKDIDGHVANIQNHL